MTGDLIINGKDAFSTWGVRMGDGFLDAIDGFNQMKDYIENESRLEHGKRVITDNVKVDSREITLQFTIEGNSESDYRTKKKAEDDYFILGSDPCHRISGRNKNCPAPPGTGLLGYYFGAYLPL